MDLRVGTCGWTDKTLLACGRFYPPTAKSAEERLRFYAANFNTVEVDSSYYNLPSERNSHLWVERTPTDFIFNIKAYQSLTLHRREQPPTELEWQMFASALRPLQEAGKLGYLLFQFPPWFPASDANRAYIRECQERLAGFQLAIQFRHVSWLATREQTHATLSFLQEHDLTYTCVDEPQFTKPSTIPPIAAVTTPSIAVLRFNGRNHENWYARGIPVYERFRYRYNEAELTEWLPQIKKLATKASVVYIMFNNCFEDDAMVNAKELLAQLREAAQIE